MIEEDHFRCDGCKHICEGVESKLEGLKVRYILTDFENHKIEHFCSMECLHNGVPCYWTE